MDRSVFSTSVANETGNLNIWKMAKFLYFNPKIAEKVARKLRHGSTRQHTISLLDSLCSLYSLGSLAFANSRISSKKCIIYHI